MNSLALDAIVREALNEDIGSGDVTTQSLVPKEHQSKAVLLMKQDGIVAGLPVVERVFQQLDINICLTPLVEDGTEVKSGTEIAIVSGSTRAMLTGERVSLNFLQRLSGVATLTRSCVKQLQGIQCDVLDTRKTTPGLRLLEKYAVRVGGGKNHRFDLSQGVMLKDNHLAMAGGLRKAVEKVQQEVGHMVQIEVEADTLAQVQEALDCSGIHAILLDNMNLETLQKAVTMIDGRIWTEASGGITVDTIREIAETGVKAVSLGWLTHSAVSMDISLDYKQETGRRK